MQSSQVIKTKTGSRPPWVGLAAAVWVQIAAGNAYNFPLYSPLLKSVLGINQQHVTILGVANDIGESVGLLPGIASNKFPPWTLLLVGSVCSFLGYGVIWLAVSGTVENMPYWLIWITLCIATNSNAWYCTAILVVNMRNFPLSRGTVAGILKGYIGISAAVYTIIYSMVLKESSSNLLLFLALGLPVVSLAMMHFIRPCTPASGEEHAHFTFTQAVSIFLAIYLLATSIISETISLGDVLSYILVVIMVILFLSPLAIPIKMTMFPSNSKKSGTLADSSGHFVSNGDDGTRTEPLLTPSSSDTYLGCFYENGYASDVETLLAIREGAVKKKKRPRRGEDFKIGEALVKADFWLLWLVYFLGVGPGVTVLNNLSQIGVSLGVDSTVMLLSLFSFCNFVGRLGSGAVSEHFVKSKTIPRTLWMACSHVIMVLSFLLYALSLSSTVYVATALLGICYGIHYSLMVPITSELFGLEHFGVIYNFMALGNPIGAILFSVLLAGSLYDAEAAKQGGSTCLGPHCFRLTFLVLASLCGLGTILSVILTIRVQPVYQMLYPGGSSNHPQSSSK